MTPEDQPPPAPKVPPFARVDETDDRLFYVYPRKVVHIDDNAIVAVGALYSELLPQGSVLLDLMSSWRSHLPPALRPTRVVGLGLNAEEMAENPQLDEAIVHDLNRNSGLPFGDEVFDAVLCAVSVQYLINPIQVFQEVNRVLRLGSPFIITFSNRCFPTKAVALWRATNDQQHIAIVAAYFQASAGWRDLKARDCTPGRLATRSDPLYAVWASKA